MSAHPKFVKYLAAKGTPIVTQEEVAKAKELRLDGFELRDIGTILGRAVSTVHYMVKGKYDERSGHDQERMGQEHGRQVGAR